MNERPTLVTTGFSFYEEIEGAIIKKAMAEFGSFNLSESVRRIIREWDKLTHNGGEDDRNNSNTPN